MVLFLLVATIMDLLLLLLLARVRRCGPLLRLTLHTYNTHNHNHNTHTSTTHVVTTEVELWKEDNSKLSTGHNSTTPYLND